MSERAESMIERVARAMARLNFKHLPEAERDKGVNMVMNVTGDIERERARAAIEAMREPTEEQIRHAGRIIGPWGGHGEPMAPSEITVWRAMIDAALK